LEHDGQTDSHLFGPSSARYELTHHAPQATSQVLYNFVREGIWHIWIGYDHILFLLSLLLPAALRRIEGRWQSGVNFRHAAWDVAKIVTAFTLAHSITLSLAALGYLALPSRWVESAIAASVVVAALNNLGGWIVSRRAGLAFAFGLVHGLGFAAVLLDLGLPKSLQLIGLVGFNIGVELGQLSIVAVVLPLITVLSRFEYYAPILLKFGSSCIAAVALVWLAERSIGFSLGLF
jgi:hypothetical protein